MTQSNGWQVYTGPSDIDGRPIRAVMTGTRTPSKNSKTGPQRQLFILPDSGESPSQAVKSGNDESVCGTCKRRPILVAQALEKATTKKERAAVPKPCYVRVFQSVNAVGRTSYPTTYEGPAPTTSLRLGAWAEPTALPYETVAALVGPTGHTGYTHRWRECDQRFREILMASVDTLEERREARAMGWRCFRTRKSHEAVQRGEIVCPASKEAGQRTTCDQCKLCAGASHKAKDVVIIEH